MWKRWHSPGQGRNFALEIQEKMSSPMVDRCFQLLMADGPGAIPTGMPGNLWARYAVVFSKMVGDKDATFAAMDRQRKADGYVGRGGVERWCAEVLKPQCEEIEADRAKLAGLGIAPE
jgi:hypothetical protein